VIFVKIKKENISNNPVLERVLGISLVIIATACWSTGGVFITRIIVGSGISPVGLAFWRDLLTSSILLIGLGLFRSDMLRVKRQDLPWLIGMGIVSIGIFHVLWNTAVMINGLAVATVIQCNAPIFVTITARIIWKETLTVKKISAIVLAIIGTILIAGISGLSSAQITITGLLIGLASAITYGSVSLFGKKLTGQYSPWTILLYAFGFGALTLLPFQFGVSGTSLVPVAGSMAGFIFLTTIGGYLFYTIGLKWLPASIASITSTTEVPFAAIMSYLFLGERLDGWQLLGAMLVVSGVILVSLPRRSRSQKILAKEGIQQP
jgi:drug/metabolite transporter (DMT)-like permease